MPTLQAAARPLSASTTLLVAALSLLGLELGVRATYDAPTPLLDKAAEYAALPKDGHRDILVLGTCLPEQILDEDRVAAALPADLRVAELASAATGPLDWALALAHHIPDDAPLAAIILAYGKADLTIEPDPWESELMDLATVGDLPLLLSIGCQDADCYAEMSLRKASRAYRYRGWLANRMWTGLHTKVPTPSRAAGDTAGPGGPEGHVQREQDLRPLQRVLDAARARGVPIYGWELPRREQLAGPVQPQAGAAQVHATLDAAGVRTLDLGVLPLIPAHFTDDVHTTAAGTAVISDAFAAALTRTFGG